MTKKSHARLERDEKTKDAKLEAKSQILGNHIYDDINDVYVNCATTIATYAESLNVLTKNELIPHMDDGQKTRIFALVSTCKDDIENLITDLVTINKPFVNKKGGEKKLEKYIDTIGVIDQFSEFIGRCKGTLNPIINSLASEISVVVDEMESKNSATNPNVVTDVEARVI